MSNINVHPATPAQLPNILRSAYARRGSLMLWGSPGIGKSTIVKQFAETNNMVFIDVRLTTLEPSDLRGLPHFDEKNKRTIWYMPEFIPLNDVPTIIFLDEITAADQRLQASAYELVLDRQIGGKPIPSQAWVVAAGNGASDGAISFSMGTALADRFQHVYLQADVKAWLDWARNAGLHTSVLAFLKVKSEYLECNKMAIEQNEMVVPTPRSWERVSDVLRYHDGLSKNGSTDRTTLEFDVSGYLGKRVATEFFGVLEEIENLPDIEKLLKADAKEQCKMVPDSITAMYGLAYSVAAYISRKEDIKAAISLFENLTQVTKTAVPRQEIQTLAMELIFEKAHKLKALFEIAKDPVYQKYKKKMDRFMQLS